jgi:hypothetical protein
LAAEGEEIMCEKIMISYFIGLFVGTVVGFTAGYIIGKKK